MIVVPAAILSIKNNASRTRDLAERGVAGIGTVRYIGRRGSVSYRYGEHTGIVLSGRSRRARERPQVGQPLVVLWDPENPERSIPLAALTEVEFA